jgi:hypothetical protein
MDKWDYFVALLLTGSVLLIFGLLVLDSQLDQKRYHDCVLAVKGASVTAADIHLICKKHR